MEPLLTESKKYQLFSQSFEACSNNIFILIDGLSRLFFVQFLKKLSHLQKSLILLTHSNIIHEKQKFSFDQ